MFVCVAVFVSVVIKTHIIDILHTNSLSLLILMQERVFVYYILYCNTMIISLFLLLLILLSFKV
jgi:hypothetical protein